MQHLFKTHYNDDIRLLAKTGQRYEARLLLEALAQRSRAERLRRVRGAQFRMDGSPRHAWQWLRSVLRRERDDSYDATPRGVVPQVVPLRSARR